MIIYVPGCQIVTMDAPDLRRSSHEFPFECQPLPTTTFNGKVSTDEKIANPNAVVDIRYMALWSHEFFGIADGFITQFNIARASLDQDYAFSAVLPDFSKDSATNTYKRTPQDATLSFMLRDSKSWNILGMLFPPLTLSISNEIPVRESYPSQVVFTQKRM